MLGSASWVDGSAPGGVSKGGVPEGVCVPEGGVPGGCQRGVCTRGGSGPGGGIPACTEATPPPRQQNDRQV